MGCATPASQLESPVSLPSARGPALSLGDQVQVCWTVQASPSVFSAHFPAWVQRQPQASLGEVWGSFDSGKSEGSASPLLGVKSADTVDLLLLFILGFSV